MGYLLVIVLLFFIAFTIVAPALKVMPSGWANNLNPPRTSEKWLEITRANKYLEINFSPLKLNAPVKLSIPMMSDIQIAVLNSRQLTF